MNKKNRFDLTNVIAVAIIFASFVFMLVLYTYQDIQLEENLNKTGDSILNSLITDTRHSLQKGERNTFQGVLDKIGNLENVENVSLYTTNKLMTYKSNEISVGFPFLKRAGRLINPNEKLYIKTNGNYMRDDWSYREHSMGKHKELISLSKEFKNSTAKDCSSCHYTLDKHLKFDKNNKAHTIGKNRSNFYYNIPVQKNCIYCHTHWKVGKSAGYLNITMDNTKIVTQSNKRLLYFFIILLIVIFSFLVIGYFIKAINKKLQSTQTKLKDQANHDSMTGLFNRRYMYDISKDIITQCIDNEEEIYLIMFDIDNFKIINDTYGHDIGDKVIISLAKEVMSCTRNSDIVARWGGEEFLILLPNTNQQGSKVLSEKIRANIEALEIENIKFTVSIGLAYFDYSEDRTIDDAIKKADDALYEAKQSGKNKVCVHL